MKKDFLIKQTALRLFSQQGWGRVSVEDICAQAGISRVTFYKYFKNKKELLKQLFIEQKEEMRKGFLALLQENSLEIIIQQIFIMQKQAMETMYSPPMLFDLQRHKDDELEQFFAAMESEKHCFMHTFFQTLQDKNIIQDQIPIILIDLFIRKIDELVKHPLLNQAYADNKTKLFQDILTLFMYGISAERKYIGKVIKNKTAL